MRPRGQWWRQGALAVFLALSALWLGSQVWGLAGKARIAWEKAREVKAEYASLEARRMQLEADLAGLATPRGADAAIREAFSVARPGEAVIILVPAASSSATSTLPWWQKLFNWF